ncbi:hypothetical protein QMG83_11870 [Salinibacterium sp. G-O1]|uniref:hypothetical protein n=1 Tax=Salinibacterium sp. G-O1 TaxID=3046208 RepID=UPI0024BB3CBA|nr:hypothetical protein [Salinibacterium sp. G-O1]MDJ0335923.1 hypothetical protein [Salinibacterium sp. G-O1]
MRTFSKVSLGLATASLLVAGLAGCSASTATTDTEETTAPAPSAEADPQPLASIPALDGVDTAVALDQGFVDALTSLGLTPGVTGTATLVDGSLHFPITGGNVDYYDPAAKYRPYVQGEILHEGSGITLTAGDTVVGLSDFKIDPGTSRLTGTVTANGEEVGKDIYIFNLDGSTLNPLESDADGNAVLQGTTVLISPDAAGLLNSTFGTDAVTDKLVVGIATITAKAKA